MARVQFKEVVRDKEPAIPDKSESVMGGEQTQIINFAIDVYKLQFLIGSVQYVARA